VKSLERGGIVVTGADRPVPDAKHHPRFFGLPSSLPSHYAYLAAKARVPVVIMAALQGADGKYHIMNSEPIEMEHDPDHAKGSLRNAEKVLRRAEDFIRLTPQQWNMPLPVWPEMLGKVPV
jgi:lauroyl/myristoyl acyltransferase